MISDTKVPSPELFTSKYMKFVKIADKPKTSVWSCRNRSGDYEIGIVKWHPSWRQYCFYPCGETVFSKGCMEDICKFITTLKAIKQMEVTMK